MYSWKSRLLNCEASTKDVSASNIETNLQVSATYFKPQPDWTIFIFTYLNNTFGSGKRDMNQGIFSE